jgi:hypothetical protein
MENSAALLMTLTVAIMIGLAAIWRELRMINGPARARGWSEHVILPMSTSAKVSRNESAEITGRVDHAFNPQRICISNAGTNGGSADWLVNDIKLAGKSIFEQSGDIPGDMFAIGPEVLDRFFTFRAIEPGQSVQIVVTYIGTTEGGVPFIAAIEGIHAQRRLSRNKRRDKAIVEVATA